MFTSISQLLAKSFEFSGRSSRSEYWKRFGLSLLLTMVFQLSALLGAFQLSGQSGSDALMTFEDSSFVGLVLTASITIICFLMLSVTARRFQDHGWSGRWFKWMFFLLIAVVLFAVIALLGMAMGSSSLTMIGVTGSFLIVFLPYASVIYTFWIGFVRADPNANQFGPNPTEATP